MNNAIAETCPENAPNGQALWTTVASEVRAIAEALMRRERLDHTLQATALVNEAYLRLVGREALRTTTRTGFLKIASRAMRCVLVDYARAHKAEKRGGGMRRITLDSALYLGQPDLDLADLDEALQRLEAIDAEAAAVVELRFFGGLSMEEVAESRGTSKRTAESHWTFARAWLRRELEG